MASPTPIHDVGERIPSITVPSIQERRAPTTPIARIANGTAGAGANARPGTRNRAAITAKENSVAIAESHAPGLVEVTPVTVIDPTITDQATAHDASCLTL
ncbi:hypothetical protein LX12_001959 [Williamsia serinedens]|uniref:Uncharacterized protein n=1 Tax=Williamsia serinedens TaxID=391736 RepID=A0ABT1H0K3_9NOCA|nr:hypothetical protein [Williamsia serinedens]